MPMGKLGAVWQLFVDFSGWTSAHGVPQIGGARNGVVRLIWTLIFLGAFGMFVYFLRDILINYFSYPVNVALEFKFEAKPFPAVTICSGNPYRWDLLGPKNETEKMAQMLIAFQDKEANGTVTSGPDDYAFATITEQSDRIRTSKLATAGFARKWAEADLKQYAYPIEDGLTTADGSVALVRSCTISGMACNHTHFMQYFDPMYGYCYTFNNKMEPEFVSTRTGPTYGLKLELGTDQSQFLPNTYFGEFRVAIHKQGDYPFANSKGYAASIGFQNSFAVQYTRMVRLPSPYGTCTEDGAGKKNYYKNDTHTYTYTADNCVVACVQDAIFSKCSCAHPEYPAADPAGPYCSTPTEVACILQWEVDNKDSWSAFGGLCDCPIMCNRTAYITTASQAYWPSNAYHPLDCMNGTAYTLEKDKRTCNAEKNRLFLTVQVHYELMGFQILTESSAFGIQDVIFGLGGQIGLWLGFSVITCVEWVSLLILILMFCCSVFGGPEFTPETKHENEIDDIEKWIDKKVAKNEKWAKENPDAIYDGGDDTKAEAPPAVVS